MGYWDTFPQTGQTFGVLERGKNVLQKTANDRTPKRGLFSGESKEMS